MTNLQTPVSKLNSSKNNSNRIDEISKDRWKGLKDRKLIVGKYIYVHCIFRGSYRVRRRGGEGRILLVSTTDKPWHRVSRDHPAPRHTTVTCYKRTGKESHRLNFLLCKELIINQQFTQSTEECSGF